ncbi:MlaD family protein [Lentisphaerota bacterium ZTH]|nr:MCE family protein [Lentisphaerota bacterium]WET07332.1 MlaD family protein [Lentisphaerota bacterium ZTH]
MNNANRIKLGVFLTLSIVLLFGSFFAVGILKLFEPKFQAMTVINASVEGLSVGSPVKYMGVPVGRITRIAMRDVDGYIDVYFNIFPSSMDMVKNDEPITASGSWEFDKVLRRKKLSCFMNASGIMGGSYIELCSSGNPKFALPELRVRPPEGVFYIKSRTSHVSNVIQNISQTVQQLTKVDFGELADKLNRTLDNADKIFNSQELKGMISRFNRISLDVEYSAKNLRQAFSEEKVAKLLKTIDFLEEGTARLRKILPAEKLKKIIEEFSMLLADAREFISKTGKGRDVVVDDISEIREKLFLSLVKFNRFMNRCSEVMHSIDDDPNQFIRGKSEKPVYNTSIPGVD